MATVGVKGLTTYYQRLNVVTKHSPMWCSCSRITSQSDGVGGWHRQLLVDTVAVRSKMRQLGGHTVRLWTVAIDTTHISNWHVIRASVQPTNDGRLKQRQTWQRLQRYLI